MKKLSPERLKELEDRMKELVPEIMELSFGCIISLIGMPYKYCYPQHGAHFLIRMKDDEPIETNQTNINLGSQVPWSSVSSHFDSQKQFILWGLKCKIPRTDAPHAVLRRAGGLASISIMSRTQKHNHRCYANVES